MSDYAYDVNGNLIKDHNKDIEGVSGDGIAYNHLNLPFKIQVKKDAGTEKGNIKYVYNAAGSKLQKITTEKNVSITYNQIAYTTDVTTTTDYVGGFIYESKSYTNTNLSVLTYSNNLQFIAHEEGRVRWVEVNNEMVYAYDYFIKDHLGDIRMVLTEEEKTIIYPIATLEAVKLATEQTYYDINPGSIRDITTNPIPGLPAYENNNGIGNNPSDPAFESFNSTKVYTLNSNVKTGLGFSVKVMGLMKFHLTKPTVSILKLANLTKPQIMMKPIFYLMLILWILLSKSL